MGWRTAADSRTKVGVILAGDLGGTNARLALYDARGRRRILEKTYDARSFRSATEVIRTFLDEHRGARPSRASLGVAGPVDGHVCKATNLPWVVDARKLARAFDLEKVVLHNDMIALAYGCLGSSAADQQLLSGHGIPGTKRGVVGVVAAGTGLGECFLIPSESGCVPMPTEGGHADFAPRNAEEARLLAFVQEVHGRVSTERILSGDGLGLVHGFVLRDLGVRDDDEAATREADPNKRIVALAKKKSPAASKAVQMFAGLLGAELGNVALRGLTRGGLFLSGGLGAAVVGLEKTRFLEAYFAKGRFQSFLESVPLAMVGRTDIGLDGSARLAAAHRSP